MSEEKTRVSQVLEATLLNQGIPSKELGQASGGNSRNTDQER